MIRTLLITALTLALAILPAPAQTIAVQGKIWTGNKTDSVDKGTIIIRNGEIVSIGDTDLPVPDDASILNFPGSWVTPGIVSPFSRIGVVEVGAESSTDDRGGGSNRISASLRAADGFNPSATSIPVTRLEGVTHVAVAPRTGATLIGGLGFVANTSGTPDSVIDAASFMYIELGEAGARKAGGSRSASWAFLREALGEGERARIGSYWADPTNLISLADARILAQVIRGRIPLMIAAHRASDIRRIIELKDEYRNLDVIILGATEGWMVASDLAAADIPVIIDPFDNLPASFERLAATSRNAERLIAAGVQTAFAHMGDDSHQARLVLQVAGNAVANGVEHSDALAAITTVPANIFGLDEIGVLKRGAQASIVIWDGDPLEITTSPQAVIINGELQLLESRQTKLRDRYLSLDQGERPFSYKKPK